MKRLLIVSYFFPPVTNMGSHRILRFVRHLREFGWEPVVLTGKLTSGPQCDLHLIEKVPTDVHVERVDSMDLTELWARLARRQQSPPSTTKTNPAPVKTQGITTFLNRWVMIPDKCFPWIKPAARAGERLIREQNIQAIYSTLDPASDHLVALRLAKRTGLPWLAEFRDLWLGSPYFARSHPTPVHRAIHTRLERQVVAGADTVACLSEGIRRYFASAYPKCRMRMLYNCFDPEEYEPASPSPSVKFTVLYAGALYSSRSPEPFFAGWARFLAKYGLGPDAAEFVILGGSPDLDLAAMAKRYGIESTVHLAGRVPHTESLRRMQSATALLAVQSPEDDVHVPGKLFEYIGARRPIFAMSRPCETADLIVHNNLGWVAEPDQESVAEKLSEAYAAWRSGGHAGLALQSTERFGIQERTRQLVDLLEEICNRK